METTVTATNRAQVERLVNSLVVPRPIAWITTVSAQGELNLAPFSYFQVVSTDPVILMISFTGEKDSLLNIQETKQFVVHVVRAENVEMAVLSSAEVARSVDEVERLGIGLAPSAKVDVPRIADSETALECVLHSTLRVGSGHLVFAEVVHVYVADRLLDEQQRINVAALAPVGRMGSNYYTVVDVVRGIDRPTPAEFLDIRPRPAPTSPELRARAADHSADDRDTGC